MHLAAAIPNFLVLEQMEHERELRNLASTQPIRFTDGYFELPEGPGLGIEPNLEALREHSFKPQPTSNRGGTLYLPVMVGKATLTNKPASMARLQCSLARKHSRLPRSPRP